MPHDPDVKQIIDSHYQRNDPLGWFEALYAHAAGSSDVIPWADEKPNPHLMQWLDREKIVGGGRSAIVVGCGLGDDAALLATRGFDVTAFDLSNTAIEWSQRRFAQTTIKFQQADLLKLPADWKRRFDFVFEAYTIQALPHSLRERAIDAVAEVVAPAGELLVVCRGREDNEDPGSLPWPLTHAEMGRFESAGLKRSSFENFMDVDRDGASLRRFRALFKREARS